MSLVKRANSKYWYVQFQIDHQTIIRSTRTTDRKVAERIAAKIRSEAVNEVMLGEKKSITLEEALDRFIASKVGTPNHANLKYRRRTVLKLIVGSTPLSRISSEILEQFKQKRTVQGCSAQTIKHGINFILGAIKMAKRDGYQTQAIDPPVVKVRNGRLRYLSIDEERRLLAELDPFRQSNGLAAPELRSGRRLKELQANYDLVVMLLDTGARYNEIATLKWDQIDLETQSIRLWRSKVANESVIFMTRRVEDILTRRFAEKTNRYVFSNSKGKPRGYSVIAIRKAIRRAGLTDCTIHTLRHTHATRLIQNGLSIYEVKAVLGHTDIRTTMRYAHLEQVAITSKARDMINRLNYCSDS